MADGAPRPAIHRREQAGCQRQHRNRDGRQSARGWLHTAAGRDPACDQCRPLQQSQFRLHPRHRAGHLFRAAGIRHRGESVGSRHDAPRVHHIRQGQPGQDQLRVGRPGHAAKHRLRTLQDDDRGELGPRPVSRRRACGRRSDQRPRPSDFRSGVGSDPTNPGRQAARPGSDDRDPSGRVSRPSTGGGLRARLRGQRFCGHWRAQEHPGRNHQYAEQAAQCRPRR